MAMAEPRRRSVEQLGRSGRCSELICSQFRTGKLQEARLTSVSIHFLVRDVSSRPQWVPFIPQQTLGHSLEYAKRPRTPVRLVIILE